ncbi:uncharacterized protein LOC130332660 [Hyla sarda]|uniref:uncharacterized protein LOC130332660 n=1 Tax=Hyla sarda TaxID=327740 RepID=UPI0024C213D3|nr:uncharacterized protein LOC130332660 [Hyla sarda]
MKKDDYLITKLYRKETATNSLLHYASFHPEHTRRGIPVGQFLRVKSNCTENPDFKMEALNLTSRFRERGYSKKVISKAYQRANSSDRQMLLKTNRKDKKRKDDSLRFVTTFNNQWSGLRRILQDNWSILQSDNKIRGIIPKSPLVVAKRAPNLKDILTSSHFQRPTRSLGRGIKLKGSFPCGSCSVCQHMTPTEKFVNRTDGQEFPLKGYVNCKTTQGIF